MGSRRLAAIALLGVLAAAPAHAKDSANAVAVAALLDGVGDIGSPGLPGSVAVWSENAFPVVVGRSDGALVPVVAAATWGKGRVVAFAHDGYLSARSRASGGTGHLVANAIRWTADAGAARGTRVRVALVGSDLVDFLRASGFDAEPLPEDLFGPRLAKFDVLLLADSTIDPPDVEAIRDFVQKGGGLLVAQTGWGWKQTHDGRDLSENALNRLVAPAGIGWTDATVDDTGGAGFVAAAPPPKLAHGFDAIDFLLGSEHADRDRVELSQAAVTAMQAVRLLPPAEAKIRPRLAAVLKRRAGLLVPTEKSPLAATGALDRFLVAVDVAEGLRVRPRDVTAHPAAASFPGEIGPGGATASRTVAVDLRIPRWHSTGLYAPPGGLVTVTLPEDAGGAKLSLRIGCHTDELWRLGSWPRIPQVSREWPLRAGVTETASAFGGLVYVVAPNAPGHGVVNVKIDGAIEAPYFELGKTTPAQWKASRTAAAPWAEIASERIVLSVPSAVVRDIDDPEPIAKFWVRVADAAADLAAIPHERPCPERYVADVEISAGYMHSGYPIMTHLDAAPRMTSIDTMQKGDWGLFHELGHNHQEPDWTFEGTGEVTNNLWSVYLHDVLTTTKGEEAHPAFRERDTRVKRYLAGGARFPVWKADPFLALFMYCDLRDAFGWDPFKKVFAEYRALPAADRPQSDDAKRDQWMTRMSRAVGKNLGPFFETWGVPTSQAARDALADLPAWAPGGGGGK